ncbi:hypothetical protein [Paenibacillus sp. H1-7]|uniref:hypothetical protein n=1 Tax=Paenibacillus sp. H1-7 TaxID=2282849 RepID=UPI001EF932DC|nr:hypothetical protein [Paenibacillus sp. H1-7]
MWIDLQENALLQMKDVGLAKEISRFSTLENAKSYYSKQEGKYAGYVNPSPTTAMATPVVVLQLQKGRR